VALGVASRVDATPSMIAHGVTSPSHHSAWPRLKAALTALYGTRPAFAAWLDGVHACLIAAQAARSTRLRLRDTQGLPSIQGPDQIGYSCYIDRFAGTLRGACEKLDYLADLGVTYFHPLPLLKPRPGDSDGGFAVMDFRAVDDRLGTLDDLEALSAALHNRGMRLCLDIVCNHTAREHAWAQAALAGDVHYQNFYHIIADADAVARWEANLGQVFPSTAPGNFTAEPALGGYVWTTFYPFQWDLNYANPAVFLAMLETLLFLANRGVDAFRLDSAPFLWKTPGTDCRNRPEVRLILEAWRAALDIVAPSVLLKAEAIVGLDDVLSFLGTDERPLCDLAYNNVAMTASWAALAEADAGILKPVLAAAAQRPTHATWLSYVRCHDDIIWAALADQVPAARLRAWSDYYAATAGAAFQAEPGSAPSTVGMAADLTGVDTDLHGGAKHILLHQIMLSLDGLPTFYMGDEIALPGDPSYRDDPARAGDARWLGRPMMDWARADARGPIFGALRTLIRARASHQSFAATYPATWVDGLPAAVLGLARSNDLLCLFNLGAHTQTVQLPAGSWRDLLSSERLDSAALPLLAYEGRWLVREAA
jgi:amylosucrase